jgi:hypothetical protein
LRLDLAVLVGKGPRAGFLITDYRTSLGGSNLSLSPSPRRLCRRRKRCLSPTSSLPSEIFVAVGPTLGLFIGFRERPKASGPTVPNSLSSHEGFVIIIVIMIWRSDGSLGNPWAVLLREPSQPRSPPRCGIRGLSASAFVEAWEKTTRSGLSSMASRAVCRPSIPIGPGIILEGIVPLCSPSWKGCRSRTTRSS